MALFVVSGSWKTQVYATLGEWKQNMMDAYKTLNSNYKLWIKSNLSLSLKVSTTVLPLLKLEQHFTDSIKFWIKYCKSTTRKHWKETKICQKPRVNTQRKGMALNSNPLFLGFSPEGRLQLVGQNSNRSQQTYQLEELEDRV